MKLKINFLLLCLAVFLPLMCHNTLFIKKLIKSQSPSSRSCVPVYFRICAVISPHSPSWRYTVETSSFRFHPAQGFLHCVTTKLKGGICDLISPGNIKEKQCFIHRHKAPEFTQIKFTCLCLKDQAWGLTRIEMIGFLWFIYNKKKDGGWGKLWVQERTGWCFWQAYWKDIHIKYCKN